MADTIKNLCQKDMEESKMLMDILEGENRSLELLKSIPLERLDMAFQAGWIAGYERCLSDLEEGNF